MAEHVSVLYDRIKANTGITFVNTYEERRLITKLKQEFKDDSIQFWSVAQGLHEIPVDTDPERIRIHHYSPEKARVTPNDKSAPTVGNILFCLETIELDCRSKIENKHLNTRIIYVLRDSDKFFNNPMVIRKFRDISFLVSMASCNIVLTGAGITVPADLEKDSAYVELKRPSFNEIHDNIIKGRICELIKAHNNAVKESGEDESKLIDDSFDTIKMSKACCGLTEDEIINTTSFSISTKKTLDEQIILEEKRQIINKNDILSYYVCDEDMSDVGGFKELKEWFDVQQLAMDSEYAKEFGVSPPKAAVVIGVQGSGKTLICKALAKQWNKGLIKLDMGRVYAGLVGE